MRGRWWRMSRATTTSGGTWLRKQSSTSGRLDARGGSGHRRGAWGPPRALVSGAGRRWLVKVDAIFQNGVFKPVSPPELREGERVRLTIEREAQATPEDILTLTSRVYEGLSEEEIAEVEAVARGAAFIRLPAGIDGMDF